MLFEKDPKTRFSLALSSGNIQEAYKNASEIKEKSTYTQLAEQSLLQGYMNVAEKSYQSIKAFNKLSFFYATQGCNSKLKKMQAIAMDLNNKNEIFENSVLLGNVRDRVKVLIQTGQLALALMSARAHNLQDIIPLIEEEIKTKEMSLADDFDEQSNERTQKAKCLLPCRPVFIENENFTTANWPHTMLVQSNMQERMNEEQADEEKYYDDEDAKEVAGKDQELAGLDVGMGDDRQGDTLGGMREDSTGEENWVEDIQLDDDILKDVDGHDQPGDPDLDDLDKEIMQEQQEDFVLPGTSNDPLKQMVGDSIIPAHHLAIGEVDYALELLRKQIGLCNPQPLEELFEQLHSNTKN